MNKKSALKEEMHTITSVYAFFFIFSMLDEVARRAKRLTKRRSPNRTVILFAIPRRVERLVTSATVRRVRIFKKKSFRAEATLHTTTTTTLCNGGDAARMREHKSASLRTSRTDFAGRAERKRRERGVRMQSGRVQLSRHGPGARDEQIARSQSR